MHSLQAKNQSTNLDLTHLQVVWSWNFSDLAFYKAGIWSHHLPRFLGGADESMFIKVPSPPSTVLTGAIGIGAGGQGHQPWPNPN